MRTIRRMSEPPNLVGALPDTPGAVHAASVPPLLDLVCELAYGWIAANLPFTTAIDLAPRTRAAERTLGARGTVITAEIPREGATGDLPEGSADLVVWIQLTPARPVGAALAEAARLCGADGTVVCVLPAADIDRAAAAPGLDEVARLALRPLIGAAIDGGADAPVPGVDAEAPYLLRVLRAGKPARDGVPSVPGGFPSTLLRDGDRALRVELAAMHALERMQEDERTRLRERVVRAEREAQDERERAGDLERRLAAADEREAELRAGLVAGEALAERARASARESAELRAELEAHQGWLQEIQSSLSWRLTRPLRRGKRAIRR